MDKILNNIMEFKSVILKTWLKDCYIDNQVLSKDEVADLCLDAYLRGMSDVVDEINTFENSTSK